MAIETKVILSSVLVHLRTSETLDDAIIKIEGMCEKDWILAAKEAAEKLKLNEKSKGPK